MWDVLRSQGVEADYVDLLKVLYSSQTAAVVAGAESRSFNVQRGVKQGDPISALLFIAVMEAIFRKLKHKWNKAKARRKGPYFGIVVDQPDDPLTNPRFADEVLLIARSRRDVGKKIKDFKKKIKKKNR